MKTLKMKDKANATQKNPEKNRIQTVLRVLRVFRTYTVHIALLVLIITLLILLILSTRGEGFSRFSGHQGECSKECIQTLQGEMAKVHLEKIQGLITGGVLVHSNSSPADAAAEAEAAAQAQAECVVRLKLLREEALEGITETRKLVQESKANIEKYPESPFGFSLRELNVTLEKADSDSEFVQALKCSGGEIVK